MNTGIRLLKISALYLVAGSLTGLWMGISQNFALTSVHVHVALLGWVAFAVAGLVYAVFPALGASSLAKVHFWGHNLSFPIMMGSLWAHAVGVKAADTLLGISSTAVVLSLLAFAVNLWVNAGIPRIEMRYAPGARMGEAIAASFRWPSGGYWRKCSSSFRGFPELEKRF